jgi:rubredoxin
LRLTFDGRLKWICPRCGAENRGVRAYVEGTAVVGIELMGEHLFYWGVLEGEELEVTGEDMYCPQCHRPVATKDIIEGFHRWLEKLKGENPREYAEILSEMLGNLIFWR